MRITMKITVKFLEGIRDKTKEKITELEFSHKDTLSMQDFIINLIEKYGEPLKEIMFWKMDPKLIQDFLDKKIDIKIDQIRFIINGNMITYEKSKSIRDGDVIVLFLPLAGG